MAELTPTPEQEAIIQATKGSKTSLMISAGAGCGKTSTLVMMARHSGPIPAMAVAFNKKIALELGKRFPQNFATKTLNGLGHMAWMRAIGKVPKLDERKLGKIVTEIMKQANYKGHEDSWEAIRSLVTAAMQAGLVPSTQPQPGLVPDDPAIWKALAEDTWIDANAQEIELARLCLIESIRQSYGMGCEPCISFDDQIFNSAMLGGVFPRFPLVMVDESQDLSVLNAIQIRRSSADRLIIVGDPRQSVYLFRGADAESMQNLRTLRPEWIDLPLMETFRCPKVVVERQQHHAPDYRAAPSNAEGLFQQWRAEGNQPIHPYKWTWPQVAELIPVGGAAAILCRNNAPLIAIAFKLLRQGIGALMLGGDIGKGLIALSRKITPSDDTSIDITRAQISEWMERESSLAAANDRAEKIAGIRDRGESLLAVADFAQARDAGGLRAAIKQIFSREYGVVTIGSIHRAKGLEYDLVLHLDPWRIPSRFAREAAQRGDRRQIQQEYNLRYVVETRTRNVLIEASLEDFA